MQTRILTLFLLTATLLPAEERAPARNAVTVTLDAMAVKNLGIETAEVTETSFAETVFAAGRIAVLPGKSAVVSSRIAGRAQSVLALPHMQCEAGDELLWVESRQPGDPPPVVRLEAPIAGVIAKVNVAPGQPVSPDDSLIEIYDLSTVEASAAVPEHLAGKLSRDLEATVRVPGFPDKVWEAKLAHLGAAADPAGGTLEAAFHLPNGDGLLRPGMRAEFSIAVAKREGVNAVPLEALQGDAVSRFVYIKDYELENAFVKTPVVTGARNDRFVEILEGLLPGDEVVTRGAYSLSFAGKGSVSLREALDAAHGHPHNEDGTEMTKEQIAAAGGAGHNHGEVDQGGPFGMKFQNTFWKVTSAGLFILLLISSFRRKSAAPNPKPEAA